MIMGLFVNLGSLLSGNGVFRKGRTSLSKPAEEIIGTTQNNENYFGNWMRSVSGSALTDAQREANAYSASREDLAWERQMAARSTAYQSQVADMKAAGINPMLAVSSSGGAALPSASAGSSVSPGTSPLNLGSLLSALVGMKQVSIADKVADADIELKESQKRKNDADAKKAASEAVGQDISNEFAERLNQLKLDLGDLEKKQRDGELKLNESEVEKNRQWIKESDQRIDLTLTQIEDLNDQILTRESIRQMYRASARLSNASADTVFIMRESQKAYLDAQTETERQKAAELVLSQAYKQGLLDEGYISAMVKDLNASAAQSRSESKRNEQWIKESDVRAALASGDFSKFTDKGRLWLWAQSL